LVVGVEEGLKPAGCLVRRPRFVVLGAAKQLAAGNAHPPGARDCVGNVDMDIVPVLTIETAYVVGLPRDGKRVPWVGLTPDAVHGLAFIVGNEDA
jgi:hypothetical protein